MATTEEFKRVNVRMGSSLHDWYQEQANELGIATTALMIIAMNDYRKKNELDQRQQQEN